MSTQSIVMMIIVLSFYGFGFIYLLSRAVKNKQK